MSLQCLNSLTNKWTEILGFFFRSLNDSAWGDLEILDQRCLPHVFFFFLVLVHLLSRFCVLNSCRTRSPLLVQTTWFLSLSNLLSFSQCFYRSLPSYSFLSFSSMLGFDLTQKHIYIHYITIHYTTLHCIALHCIHTCTHIWMNGSIHRYMHTYKHTYIAWTQSDTNKACTWTHGNTDTWTHRHKNILGNIIQIHSGIFPDVWGEISQKRSGTFPKLVAKFLTNTRNVPNYLFFEWGSRRFSEAGPKSTWTTNSIFFGRPIFWWSSRFFIGGAPSGDILRSNRQQHLGLETFPIVFWKKMPSFGRSSPKTLGNVPEFFPQSPNTLRNVPEFFSGGGFWGKSSEAAPQNTRERSRFFFGRLTLGKKLSSPQKHSGTFPNFFSGRLTLGETLGSSPQKHSGTFPNFFSGGWL